jgi:hypothetical protein
MFYGSAAYGVHVKFHIARPSPEMIELLFPGDLGVPYLRPRVQHWLVERTSRSSYLNIADRQPHPREATAKDRVRGQGPGTVGPASPAPVRPGAGRECARGPATRTPRPQERRRRRRGTERVASPAPLFRRERVPCEHRNGQDRCRLLPSSCCQNSSSIAPCTVWTTRLAK